MTERVRRYGARVLLLDESGRVLLIRESLEDGSTHWLTPGGGIEPGEQPRRAAEREAREETGIDLSIPDDAEPVLVTRREWSWAGVVYDQSDDFFLVRVPDGTPAAPLQLTEVEQQTWLELRWWPVAELAGLDEPVVPADLATVLAGLLRTSHG